MTPPPTDRPAPGVASVVNEIERLQREIASAITDTFGAAASGSQKRQLPALEFAKRLVQIECQIPGLVHHAINLLIMRENGSPLETQVNGQRPQSRMKIHFVDSDDPR